MRKRFIPFQHERWLRSQLLGVLGTWVTVARARWGLGLRDRAGLWCRKARSSLGQQAQRPTLDWMDLDPFGCQWHWMLERGFLIYGRLEGSVVDFRPIIFFSFLVIFCCFVIKKSLEKNSRKIFERHKIEGQKKFQEKIFASKNRKSKKFFIYFFSKNKFKEK